MDNFEKIKQEMAAARKSAEKKSKTAKVEPKIKAIIDEDTIENELTITIKPSIKKNNQKKAVNYYLSVDLIEEIENKAQKYNKKNSVFLEELLKQVIYNI